jgi:hypothetical protein
LARCWVSIQAQPADAATLHATTAAASQAVALPINLDPLPMTSSSMLHRFRSTLAALLAAACGQSALAQTDSFDGWELSLSPYTIHFHPSDEHKPVVQVGLMKGLEDRWLAGGAVFSNSFGQPSAYVFGGQRYVNPFGWEKWYLQWTAGILYGYVGQYKDKVPFNYKGFSPGLVPSIGYQFTDRIYGELDLLGNSALMFTVVFPIPKGGF